MLYLVSDLICTKGWMFCVPGLGFPDVPGLGLYKKCPEYIPDWCFLGYTEKWRNDRPTLFMAALANPSSSL